MIVTGDFLALIRLMQVSFPRISTRTVSRQAKSPRSLPISQAIAAGVKMNIAGDITELIGALLVNRRSDLLFLPDTAFRTFSSPSTLISFRQDAFVLHQQGDQWLARRKLGEVAMQGYSHLHYSDAFQCR